MRSHSFLFLSQLIVSLINISDDGCPTVSTLGSLAFALEPKAVVDFGRIWRRQAELWLPIFSSVIWQKPELLLHVRGFGVTVLGFVYMLSHCSNPAGMPLRFCKGRREETSQSSLCSVLPIFSWRCAAFTQRSSKSQDWRPCEDKPMKGCSEPRFLLVFVSKRSPEPFQQSNYLWQCEQRHHTLPWLLAALCVSRPVTHGD